MYNLIDCFKKFLNAPKSPQKFPLFGKYNCKLKNFRLEIW